MFLPDFSYWGGRTGNNQNILLQNPNFFKNVKVTSQEGQFKITEEIIYVFISIYILSKRTWMDGWMDGWMDILQQSDSQIWPI